MKLYIVFFKQKTAYEMRISDWSSDVCSSDLVGRALMAQPRLLMLDEPSLGLAPKIVREIFHIISRLRRTGVSILLVEQNARAALQVADYGYVLETGEVVLEGRASDLVGNPRDRKSTRLNSSH